MDHGEGGWLRALTAGTVAAAIAALASTVAPVVVHAQGALSLRVDPAPVSQPNPPSGSWVSLVATISNAGADFSGTLEITGGTAGSPSGCRYGPNFVSCGGGVPSSSGQSMTYRTPVDIAAGATQHIPLTINAAAAAPRALLLDRTRTAVAQAEVRISSPYNGGPRGATVAVVADRAGTLDAIGGLRLPGGQQPVVVDLRPADLPAAAAVLDDFLAVIIDGAGTGSLSAGQRRALGGYVAGGGTLVLAATARWADTVGGLADVLVPATAEGTVTLPDLPASSAILGIPEPGAPVQLIRLQPGSGAVVSLSDHGIPVEVDRRVDQGRVVVLAVDPAAAGAVPWEGRTALLRHVLVAAQQAPAAVGTPASLRNGQLTGVLDQVPGLQLPSPGLLGVVIILYILVAGPVAFIALGRARRRSLVWAVVPALAVVTTGLIVTTGLGSAGHDAVVNLVRVVTVDPASGTARVETFGSIYLQHGGTREVHLGGDPLLAAYPASGGGGSTVLLPTQGSVRIEDAAPTTLHSFVAESVVPYGRPLVSGALLLANHQASGLLTNRTGTTLLRTAVVAGPGGSWAELGAVAPGGSLTIHVSADPSVTSLGTGVPGCMMPTIGYPAAGGASLPDTLASALLASASNGVCGSPTFSSRDQLPAMMAVTHGPLPGLPAVDTRGMQVTETDAVIVPLQVTRTQGDATAVLSTLVDMTDPTTAATYGATPPLQTGGRGVYAADLGGGTWSRLTVSSLSSCWTKVPCAYPAGSSGQPAPVPSCPPSVACAQPVPAPFLPSLAGGPSATAPASVEAFDRVGLVWRPLLVVSSGASWSAALPDPQRYVATDGVVLLRVSASAGATVAPPLVLPVAQVAA